MATKPLGRIDDELRTKMADGYRRQLPLIRATVSTFAARYGGHVPSLIADASLAFFRAYQNDEITDSKVKSWVWFNLLDWQRPKLTRAQKLAYRPIEEYEHPTGVDTPPGDKWDKLSEDATIITRIVLDPPEGLVEAVEARGGKARNWRPEIRVWMAKYFSWSNERCSLAFDEIGQLKEN